ncbi:hypothetical protein EUX98_g9693 [Antrodiella citrinella]|uniref:Uncharacterized protein n=1 Tax=Antrodiella citrinella TaxID=2447956 RepID=A0A4S4LN74_9APHY|nr:hypothetical protein EUX98_g9693 [Antrodiella citrinella]
MDEEAATSPQDAKVKATATAIKSNGWRSVNDFIVDYYRSSEGPASLRFVPGRAYGLERILQAWTESVPSENAREKLNMVITQKATEIIVKESTNAIRRKDLQLSATTLTIPLLTTDFALSKIYDIYTSILPCLFFLLNSLLTATNDYERSHRTEKLGKDEMARQMILVLISMLLFRRNRATTQE